MKIPEKFNSLKGYARYSSIALQMGVIIFAGTFGGLTLDAYLKWKIPVFTVVFSLTSVAVAIYIVIKDLLKK
ncbi:MAG: AtpZ/AtpI family protein [Bacteroidota bacterium]